MPAVLSDFFFFKCSSEWTHAGLDGIAFRVQRSRKKSDWRSQLFVLSIKAPIILSVGLLWHVWNVREMSDSKVGREKVSRCRLRFTFARKARQMNSEKCWFGRTAVGSQTKKSKKLTDKPEWRYPFFFSLLRQKGQRQTCSHSNGVKFKTPGSGRVTADTVEAGYSCFWSGKMEHQHVMCSHLLKIVKAAAAVH